MIIYPIAILLILLVGFLIVWRRAAILEAKGMLEKEIAVAKHDKHYFSFWAKKEDKEDESVEEKKQPENVPKTEEIEGDKEVSIEKPVDPSFIKAEELFKKKQYISAEKWYLEAIKNDPKNAEIYARLGIIYIEQKNYVDALESLEESVKLNPGVAGRFFNLSFVYNANGDNKNAILNAKRAYRLDSQNEKYKDWLEHLKSSPF